MNIKPLIPSNTLSQNCSKNTNVISSSFAKQQPSFGAFSHELKNKKIIGFIKWMSKEFTSAHTRFILGVTAVLSQPFFDFNNRKVDEKTRAVSAARTLAKIVAGTLSGVAIRHGFIKLTERYCKTQASEAAKLTKKFIKNNSKKITNKDFSEVKKAYKEMEKAQKNITIKDQQKILLPENSENISNKVLQKYRYALGTFVATVVMVFTNFAIDAPLTKFFTKLFMKKIGVQDETLKHKSQIEAEGGKQ